MKKQKSDMTFLAKYIACGMIIGSALGTGTAVLMKTAKKSNTGTAHMLRSKAANAMDTVGIVMQNLADLTR